MDRKRKDGDAPRGLAVVTGASSGIGLALARCCAEDGYDLVIAADRPIDEAKRELAACGVDVEALEVDLATLEGVDRLYDLIGARTVELLLANAGHGLGGAFLDQRFDDIRHVIDTNVTGGLYLVHRIGHAMRARDAGRILFTGSIAGFMPGTFNAVYNATKAFVDSFALALRDELKESGITVTCLMPGATDTEFFERAGMLDTKIGQEKKMDPAKVARIGYEAMMKGEADVVAGLKNKLQAAAAHLLPAQTLAEQHRKKAEPGSARR